MKAKHTVCIMILTILLLLIMIPNIQAVTGFDNALNWTFEDPVVPMKVSKIIGTIIKGLRNLSIIVTVVVIVILGLKYMVGSIEQKSDYKKDFPNIIIGVTVIAGVFSIISVIFSAVEGIV